MMQRRDFLMSAIGAAGAGALLPALADDPNEAAAPARRQYYELRLYHLRRGPQTELFDKFYRDAAIPAYNRAGISRVGIFGVMVGPDSPSMYVLLPHPDLNSVILTHKRMVEDSDFLEAGAEFLDAPPTAPAYDRIESSLMIAFAGMPQLAAPSFGGGGKSRLFELRTYESHSVKAHLKKVEMFNRWEMGIFKRTGLNPVFFGQTFIGQRQPNLTYMLAFENAEARDKGWAAFGGDAEWKKVRSTPGYTDPEVVSNITNLLLRPAPYSQI